MTHCVGEQVASDLQKALSVAVNDIGQLVMDCKGKMQVPLACHYMIKVGHLHDCIFWIKAAHLNLKAFIFQGEEVLVVPDLRTHHADGPEDGLEKLIDAEYERVQMLHDKLV
jgi:hypothetical protein